MNKIELMDEKAETIEEKMKAGPIIPMSFFILLQLIKFNNKKSKVKSTKLLWIMCLDV